MRAKLDHSHQARSMCYCHGIGVLLVVNGVSLKSAALVNINNEWAIVNKNNNKNIRKAQCRWLWWIICIYLRACYFHHMICLFFPQHSQAFNFWRTKLKGSELFIISFGARAHAHAAQFGPLPPIGGRVPRHVNNIALCVCVCAVVWVLCNKRQQICKKMRTLLPRHNKN